MVILPAFDMAADRVNKGLHRREAVGMDELVEEFIRDMKLVSGVNARRAAAAWEAVSGAGKFTVDVFLRNRVLYCTIGSSMVRSQLYFQKEALISQLNQFLENDELFVKEGVSPYITDIIFK